MQSRLKVIFEIFQYNIAICSFIFEVLIHSVHTIFGYSQVPNSRFPNLEVQLRYSIFILYYNVIIIQFKMYRLPS